MAKRMKRAHLKRWSANVVKVKSRVDKATNDLMGEYNARAERLEDMALKLFGVDLNEGFGVTHGNGAIPRAEVLKKLEIIERDKLGIKLKNNIALENGKKNKLFMFFGGRGEGVYFVQVKGQIGVINKSIVYRDRARAMEVWREGAITYIERMILSSG